MANAIKKATVNQNTKSQEDKTMSAKKIETKKATVVKQEVATAATKTAEVKNEEKKDSFLSIEQVTELYKEYGIKCTNLTCKGNYRIMGSKSSLNVKPKKGYYIYSSESDFELVSKAGLKGADLVIEKGTNSQDKSRPHTIICTAKDTLVELLKVYATNPLNVVAPATTTEVAVKTA